MRIIISLDETGEILISDLAELRQANPALVSAFLLEACDALQVLDAELFPVDPRAPIDA